MSDIDIAVADSLKVLDLKRPIREADVTQHGRDVGFGPIPEVALLRFAPCGRKVRFSVSREIDPIGLRIEAKKVSRPRYR